MAQAHHPIDRLTLLLIAGVGVLHLWALHPIDWARHQDDEPNEVEVLIEVAANRPTATATEATPATPALTPLTPTAPTPVSAREKSNDAPPQPVQPRAAQAAAQGTEIPSTQVSYEVGSAKNPRPPYPPGAFQARIEGRVILKIHVMPDGKPAEIQLLQTSGSAQLDKSALDTVARWELQPASKNGEPIDQWVEIPINFRILQK